MINRRTSLKAMAAVLAGSVLPVSSRAELPDAADTSSLIYLTPIRSDGRESRCQSEVWFVRDGQHLYVVTAADAWRAEAVRRGLTRARIWIGDVGVWDDDGRYRSLPQIDATASLVVDPEEHARLLERFGVKYTAEWGTWGPRFRNGLADGSRVMLSYRTG